jgi:aminoglycoside phosphotransferase family enzyme
MNISSLLIQSLQNPALYPHKVEYFKVIETHISWVLLTGYYAYKIKKPFNLGFLDFSSLEKRRHYCQEELRLNSRLAPDIYLDIVTISGTEKQPKLGASGTVIEYAVKMRQFEEDKTFDLLLAQNQLTHNHVKQTAKIIAAFHSGIESTVADTDFGSSDTIMQFVRENFIQILQLDGIEKPDSLNQLASWSEQQHTALLPFFKQRKQAGFIRECHGDLHLGNIALIAGQVVPFDGIEFNPYLYWIDVISEIAFLVMDLQDKQRHDLGFQFLNEYLQYNGDYDGLKLLRFYLVYRAMVRAKVNAIRASQSTSDIEHEQIIVHYSSYLL